MNQNICNYLDTGYIQVGFFPTLEAFYQILFYFSRTSNTKEKTKTPHFSKPQAIDKGEERNETKLPWWKKRTFSSFLVKLRTIYKA